MAVNVVSSGSATGSSNTHTFENLATSGSNRFIIVFVFQRDNPGQAISSVSRGSDTYALKANLQDEAPILTRTYLDVWESTNEPQTASANLTITLAGSPSGWIAGYIILENVDQTTPTDTESTDNGTSTGPSTIALTGDSGDLLLSIEALRDTDTSFAGNQTVLFAVNNGDPGGNINAGVQHAAGGASTNLTWSWTDSDGFAHIAFVVNQAAVQNDDELSVMWRQPEVPFLQGPLDYEVVSY